MGRLLRTEQDRLRLTLGVLAGLIGITLVALLGLQHVAGQPRSAAGPTKSVLQEAYARLPLTFVENLGQADGRVRYLAHGTRYGFFLTPEALVMSLLKPDGTTGVNLRLDFVGASREVAVGAAHRAPGTVSYLKEGSPQSGLPSYGEVVYKGLWPGVDMAVNGRDGVLKYEFRLAPGAKADGIRLAYRGADRISTGVDGALVVDTAAGPLRDSAPVSYQIVDGRRVPVESRYVLDGESYGFAVGGYDPAHGLVIDPGLEYSTFLGGFGNQIGEAIAVDATGHAYVTGFTQSPTFPTTPGAFDRTGATGQILDAFVSKLNPTGTALVYSTFLGGSNFEWGRDIAVDAAGNAYIAGQTKSSNFPTTSGAFDRTFNVDTCPRCGIDQYDAFLTKLNPSGSALVYSTFLGGFGIDDGMFLALDGAGQVYLAGETASSNFPTTAGAFDTTANGGSDVYVAKFNTQGSQLLYSTRLGGADNELPGGIAVDPSGNAVVSGSTRSVEFPSTPGTVQPAHSGGEFLELFEGFVTKLNSTGTGLVYSTFLGGTKRDSLGTVFLDSAGNAYVSGGTFSPEFTVTPGTWDDVFDNGSESFIVKLDPAASAILLSTFLDGAGGSFKAFNPDGSVWLAGGGGPNSFVTPDAWDTQFSGGNSDAYVAKLNATFTGIDYATFLGGTDSEGAFDLAVDPAGNIYFTGRTFSADFPVTAGAFDRVYSGDSFILGSDAWVAKIGFGPNAPTPPPSPPAIPGAPVLASPADAATVTQPVTFDWNDVEHAVSYTIQVDEISAFGAPLILTANVGTSGFTTGSLPQGNWFWRVRAVNPAGTPGPWSATRAITVQGTPIPPSPSPSPTGAPGQPLPAPSLQSPGNDARFSPGTTVTFNWGDVAGAASYTIQVDTSESFSAPFTVEVTVTDSQHTAAGLPTQRMWWRVRANSATGQPGNWSGARRFELKD
jgi:Beta-propeller repeat